MHSQNDRRDQKLFLSRKIIGDFNPVQGKNPNCGPPLVKKGAVLMELTTTESDFIVSRLAAAPEPQLSEISYICLLRPIFGNS
jgi:hypothetical protein